MTKYLSETAQGRTDEPGLTVSEVEDGHGREGTVGQSLSCHGNTEEKDSGIWFVFLKNLQHN